VNEVGIRQPILSASKLEKRFGRRTVVRGVSLAVAAGEIVGLLGPNGAGKTTTFRMVMGLLRPDGGTITFHDADVTDEPIHVRAERGMGYLSQEPSVFRGLTVEQNLRAVLEWIPDMGRAEETALIDEMLETLHISGRRKQRADTLSGGERRRLELARVLARRPSIILLDEPFLGVDPKTVEEIQTFVRGMARSGLGVLLTDHNARETLAITDRSYVIGDGEIIREGTPAQLVEDPAVRRLYLGDTFTLKDLGLPSAEHPDKP
jgi:lipopolysaccharide export system ATP-binding protein